jgi:hypothetical protein
MGAPGELGSSGGSKGRETGARQERDAVGSVTRARLRRKNGEPDSEIEGGTAFGGGWSVEEEGMRRGDVRASCKFCMAEDEGEIGEDDCGESEVGEGSFWPTQRKTGRGDLWGGCCKLGGRVGMSCGDKLKLVGRGLSLAPSRLETARFLEACMSRLEARR